MSSAETQLTAAPSRYQPLVIVLAAAATGIVTDREFAVPWSVWLAVAIGSLWAWRLMWRRCWWVRANLCLLLAVAACAAAWHHSCWRLFREDEIGLSASVEGQPICLEAIAATAVRHRPAPPDDPMRSMPAQPQSFLVLQVMRLRNGVEWQAASGQVTLTVYGELQAVRPGDQLRVYGRLISTTPPLNPGDFDFSAHQRGDRLLCRLDCDAPACCQVLKRASPWRLAYVIPAIREQGDAMLWRYLRREPAGLATAVLLGIRENVDFERQESFLVTGTVHILSISGLHVGMLAYGFWLTARIGWLSRRATLYTAIGLILFYTVLTYAQPPVVRAAVLICVMCVARLLGRRAFDFNTLALAAWIVLIMNPSHLFGTGTQLSFLAVATLACLQRLPQFNPPAEDPLDRLIRQSRPWPIRLTRDARHVIWQVCLTSTAVWLISLPLVMYRFHVVSPIAVLLNPIVWLPMSIALFAGFGVLVTGYVVPPLAALCGWICDRSLWFIEWCVGVSMHCPLGYAWVPAPPWWWVVSFYVALLGWVILPRRRPARLGPILAAIAIWFGIGFLFTVGPWARSQDSRKPQLTCTFAAVGHGTSVLVELPDGRTMLYDAGSWGSSRTGVRPISAMLWSRGLTHLDAVVISHADTDHFNALPDLLDRFSVGVIYVSPVMFREPTPALDALQAAFARAGVEVRELSYQQRLEGGPGVELEILHPSRSGVIGIDNANSIVLRVAFAGRSLLLPGDLEGRGLQDVMAESPLDSEIVMAPHHGSLHSNPAGFAAWSTPEVVVISGGQETNLAAVREAYTSQGATVLHTASDGAIQITLGRDGVTAAKFDHGNWRSVSVPGWH